MTLTLGRYLETSTLANLVVADIAPIKGRVSRASVSYIDAMRKIDSLKLKTRKEAKEVLAEWEKVILTGSGPLISWLLKMGCYRRIPVHKLSF
jgi:hypothetical protein